MTAMASGAIAISAMLAFLVNISTFMIIGKMSAITYNVAGHAKLCFVLAMGYILFDNKFSWLNVFGVCIAIIGVIAYSVIRMLPADPTITFEKTSSSHTSIVLNPIQTQNINPIVVDKENENSQRRSLLILNDEPIINGGNKILPFIENQKTADSDTSIFNNNERVKLIK